MSFPLSSTPLLMGYLLLSSTEGIDTLKISDSLLSGCMPVIDISNSYSKLGAFDSK